MKKYILLLSLFFINLHPGQSISIQSIIPKLRTAGEDEFVELAKKIADKIKDKSSEEMYEYLTNLFEFIEEAWANRLFKFLITQENIRDEFFDLSCVKRNQDIVKFFLNHGYKYSRYHVLINAAKSNDLATVMFFVENIQDLDWRMIYVEGFYFNTNLIDFLFMSQNMLIIKYLLDKFTEKTIDANNKNYWLIIKYIIQHNSLESLKYLISLNIDLNAKNSDGDSILHMVFKNAAFDSLEYLIQNCIRLNINAVDTENKTIFYHACEVGSLTIVKLLVQNCPNLKVNIQENNGSTAIQAAFSNFNFDIVKYLINNCQNLNLDILDFQNDTLLHIVCKYMGRQNLDIIELLLEKKCAILKNANNRYPFELLLLKDLIKLLLKLGDRIPEFIKPEYLGDHAKDIAVTNLLLQQSVDINNPELSNILATMSSNVSTYSSVKNSISGLLSWINMTRSQTDLERFNELKNIYKNKLLTGNLSDMKKLDYAVIKTLFSHSQLAEILVTRIAAKDYNEEAMLVLIRKISVFYNIKNLIYNDNNIFWHALRYNRVKLAVLMLTINNNLLKSVPSHMFEITDLALINIRKELLKKEQEDIMNQINRANSNQSRYNHQRY